MRARGCPSRTRRARCGTTRSACRGRRTACRPRSGNLSMGIVGTHSLMAHPSGRSRKRTTSSSLEVKLCSTRMKEALISIGELAVRSGVATSALRFYESEGLDPLGPDGRRPPRLSQERPAPGRLHPHRTAHGSHAGGDRGRARDPACRPRSHEAGVGTPVASWRAQLDDRIAALEGLRDDLTGCIGCGCLSLKSCTLYNPDDVASSRGTGPRYLLGDDPDEVQRAGPPALRPGGP